MLYHMVMEAEVHFDSIICPTEHRIHRIAFYCVYLCIRYMHLVPFFKILSNHTFVKPQKVQKGHLLLTCTLMHIQFTTHKSRLPVHLTSPLSWLDYPWNRRSQKSIWRLPCFWKMRYCCMFLHFSRWLRFIHIVITPRVIKMFPFQG